MRAACASSDVMNVLASVEDYGYAADGPSSSTNNRTLPTVPTMRSKNFQRTKRAYSNSAVGGDAIEFTPDSEASSDFRLDAWKKQIWQDANKTLLLAYKPLSAPTTGSSGHQKPTLTKHSSGQLESRDSKPSVTSMNLLWSRVFRKPFLHQVESALHASSVSGMYRVQQRIMRALYCVGVVVDLTMGMGQTGAEGRDSVSSADVAISVRRAVNSNTALYTRPPGQIADPKSSSSVHIYHLAEELRRCLADELIDLRTGIQLSEEDADGDDTAAGVAVSDKESTHTLARSVQIYSCQLIGQVVALTRCLAEACRDAAHNLTNRAMADERVLMSGYKDLWENSISDGLLLLGRFAWLLKINGAFLSTSLSFSAPAKSAQLKQSSGKSILSKFLKIIIESLFCQ